jgi:hypothetical protein
MGKYSEYPEVSVEELRDVMFVHIQTIFKLGDEGYHLMSTDLDMDELSMDIVDVFLQGRIF